MTKPYGFQKTGFNMPTFTELLDDLKADSRSGTNTSDNSVVGMLLGIVAFSKIQLYELMQQASDSFDVDKAEGIWLEKQVKPIFRNAETRSAGEVFFSGKIGTTIPARTEVGNGNVFRTIEEFTIQEVQTPTQILVFQSSDNSIKLDYSKWNEMGVTVGSKITITSLLNAGEFTVESIQSEDKIIVEETIVDESGFHKATFGATEIYCEAIDFGPVSALEFTINEIVNPVTDLDAVFNSSDFEIGKTTEQDPELRARFYNSFSSLLVSDLLEVDRVTFARVYANRESVVDDIGVPPRSVSVVVYPDGPPSYHEKIATVITRNVDPYEPLVGNVEVTLVDSQGRPDNIKFYIADEKELFVKVDVVKDSTKFPKLGDEIIKALITEFGQQIEVGQKVLSDEILIQIMTRMPGILSIDIKVGLVTADQDFIDVGFNSIALFPQSNIEVNIYD